MSKMPKHVEELRLAGGNRPLPRGSSTGELFDVFRRIDMHDGNRAVCWEWLGAHGLGTRGEYRPRVVIRQKDYYVYRIVYQLYTGAELKPTDVVRHECDNCWCCNPFHMIIGSQADNVQDMLKRERVGMKHFHVKRIMQMLETGAPASYVCDKMREGYNMTVDVSIVRKIRMRRIYKHIEWPWGDDWAAQRKQRLADLRSSRVASHDVSATIGSTQTEGDNTDG
jgi:hypothetical protein